LLLLVSVTVNPPVGATPLSMTVPVEEPPPDSVEGFKDSEERTGGKIASVLPIELAPRDTVILADVFAATGDVEIPNVVVLVPAGTDTDVGTFAAAWLLVTAITSPPTGAAELILIEPVALAPPVKLVGTNEKVENVGALTVNTAEAELAPIAALIVAEVLARTATVWTVNVPLVLPDSIVTDEITVAEAVDDESVTTAPCADAFLAIETVPVEFAPPTTEVGERVTFATVCALARATGQAANRTTKARRQSMGAHISQGPRISL